jgi:hypothetical protein
MEMRKDKARMTKKRVWAPRRGAAAAGVEMRARANMAFNPSTSRLWVKLISGPTMAGFGGGADTKTSVQF